MDKQLGIKKKHDIAAYRAQKKLSHQMGKTADKFS